MVCTCFENYVQYSLDTLFNGYQLIFRLRASKRSFLAPPYCEGGPGPAKDLVGLYVGKWFPCSELPNC